MKLKTVILREMLFLLYILVIIVILHYLHHDNDLRATPPQPLAPNQQVLLKPVWEAEDPQSLDVPEDPPNFGHKNPRLAIPLVEEGDDVRKEGVPVALAPARPLERELPLQNQRSLPTWKKHLQYYCSQMELDRRTVDLGKLKHLIVDDQHKVIFCPVAKVASTNWKRVFLVLGHHVTTKNPRGVPAPQVHRLAGSRLQYLGQFPPSQARRRLQSYFKFMVSRDPFERLLSAYRNKVGNAKNKVYQRSYARMIAKRYRQRPSDVMPASDVSNVTFVEFLQYVVDPTLADHTDPHWARETDVCHPCTVRYDFVGHADRLEEDANLVLRKIHAPRDLRFPHRPISKKSSRDLLRQYYSQVPAAFKDQIYRRYYADFVLFNHSVPTGVQTDTRDLA